jgi:hypothetical protein
LFAAEFFKDREGRNKKLKTLITRTLLLNEKDRGDVEKGLGCVDAELIQSWEEYRWVICEWRKETVFSPEI